MPSALKKALILVLALLIVAVGLVLALAGTQPGTRWLAEQARHRSGDTLAWDRIEGSLLGSLRVQGLRVRQPALALDIDKLMLDWRPTALVGARLQVDRLEVAGVRVAVPASDEPAPPPAEPFRPADLRLPVDVRLEDVQVHDLRLQIGEQPERTIDRIALAGGMEAGRLQLALLEVRAPEGGLSASGFVELSQAMPLAIELQWDWLLPDRRRVGGRLQASGDAQKLALEHTGSGDLPVDIRGEIRDILGAPGWELDLSWPELALTAAEEPLRLGPARVHTGGSLESYEVTSDGRFEGMGLASSVWSLQATGDASGLQLTPLVLTTHPVDLELTGQLDWSGPFAADLQYRVTGDDLATFQPALPERLDARGELQGSFRDGELTLERMTVALDQAPTRLELDGSVRLPEGAAPDFAGRLQWHALQWPLAGADPGVASAEGHLEIGGTPDAYEFSLAADVAGTQVPPGDWEGQGSGDSGSLQLQRLHGALLAGELNLTAEVGWTPVVNWSLQAGGNGLDPGQWRPELPGQLALTLQSSGRIDPEEGPQAAIELQRLAGRLVGRDLDLTATAAMAGEALTLDTLQLDVGGNQLSASGRLSPRLALEWQLQAPSPGTLLQGADGSLAASGRIEGAPSQPRLEARLQGRDLRLDTRSLDRLQGTVQAGLGSDDPLQVDLELGPVQQEELQLLQAAHLRTRGTTADHWLELDLQSAADQLQARLEGGLDPAVMTWKGRIAGLDAATSDYGEWRLAQPASLALAAAGSSLGETCLQSMSDSALVCTGGDWTPTGGASLAARLQALPVKRFLPNLSGELSGDIDAGLAADGALRARAAFAMSPGDLLVELAQGTQRFSHDGGRLDLTIGPKGLDAALQVEARERRLVDAELRLPRFDRLPPPEPQPLAGHIRAEIPDLSGLHALVPALADSAGRLDADLRLAGTLQQPEILGELALENGAADIPMAGLQLRQIELRAVGDAEHPGELALSGGLVSGEGRVDIDGRAALSGDFLAMTLKGDRLQVYNTPDAHAVASPDLRIGWDDQVLTLRGRVVIPEASITPQLGLSPGLLAEEPGEEEPGRIIAPSADVVVLGADGERSQQSIPAAPFRLDNQVELILGERVNVSALGLAGRLSGAVTFTNQPGNTDLVPDASGRLSIEDGTFRAFGQDLDIETGRVLFDGGPVTRPEISLRAVRWIDNDPLVTAAGVVISGSATEPSLEFFSRPALDETAVQSYLFTGRGPGEEEQVLSVGTYLHPKFYVGYGYDVLEETSEFNALYIITPRYGVSANVGEADNNVNLTFTHER